MFPYDCERSARKSLLVAQRKTAVWSVEFYVESTHVTPPERAAINAIVDAKFGDVVPSFTPGLAVYTYWDYTQLAFRKGRGMPPQLMHRISS